MPVTPEQVVSWWNSRRTSRGGEIGRMVDTQRLYNGDVIIPLPEMDEDEAPAVANLLVQGIDQLGMRASGRDPDVVFPSAKPGNETSDATVGKARQAVLAWWDMNQITKKRARQARYLVAYGSGPTMISPVTSTWSDKRDIPRWRILDPLCIFASDSGDPDDIEPHDVIVEKEQTLAWLQERYPLPMMGLFKGKSQPPDKIFTILEYNDADETVLVVVGAPRNAREYVDPANGTAPCALLERAPNRAGICLAVVPGRITLDRLSGQFDLIKGMFLAQARLQAYSEIAIRKGIFPELWAVTHPGSPSTARIVRTADGKQGIIGEIENGTIVQINPQPGQMVGQEIDRYERNQRVQGSIPADWGGESATNIRTAKRGEQVASSASDPTLAELQTVLAEAIEAEDRRAIAISKGYWGNKMTSFYVPHSGKKMGDDYRPNEVFANDFHFVKFSMPGVDAASIPIELGQRTQTGEISMDTARRSDPMVEDADHERQMVDLEKLRMATLTATEQGAASGSLDPHEIAMIAQKYRMSPTLEIEDALLEVHNELQAQQAALPQAPPGAPEAQPGLAPAPPPGAPPAAGGGPPPPLAQLLAGLRQPEQQSAPEQQLSPAGA